MNVIKNSSVSVWICSFLLFMSLSHFHTALAANGPFTGGWELDTSSSSLSFQSIKNGSTLETSNFASFSGSVSEQGAATIRVQLDSVDTKIDLRNVRMRFLFFETFKFSEAVITTSVDPASIADLAERQTKNVTLNFYMDLHGIKQFLQAETIVSNLPGGQVSVASSSPLTIPTRLFGLDEGVRKLEDAAGVSIMPSGVVSFNFVFNRGSGSELATQPVAMQAPATTALESAGNFSVEECAGRFEILSRTGAIYFRTGSATLDPDSESLLATIINIVNRCPQLNIVIAGHTDSSGSAFTNLRLSETRAQSVWRYLIDKGVNPNRLRPVGYGEVQPVAPNDTPRNMRRNRRIEFMIDTG